MSDEVGLYFGRVGKEPQLKRTKNNESLCLFTLACPTENPEVPDWKNIVVWGKQAEVCNICLKKGAKVFIEGVIKKRDYTNLKGERRVFEELKAKHVGFVNC